MRGHVAALIGTLATLVACGGDDRARPIVPRDPVINRDAGPMEDIPLFMSPDAVPIRPPQSNCGGTQASLTRRRASVLLVIDRSGSMADPTADAIRTSRWSALLTALDQSLPAVNADLSLGLQFFPEPYVITNDAGVATEEQICGVATSPRVSPAPNNATAVLSALRTTLPGGATPTSSAIEAALNWFIRDPDRTGEQIILLATDGGPNCNPGFDQATCVCTGPADRLCRNNIYGRLNCLDADRTVATVARARAMGVTTIVLGLSGTEDFGAVLDGMAVAGGRPRAGTPRYYNVQTSADLVRELSSLTSALAECRFALDAPPPDPLLVDVRLGGISLIRDDSRRDGWAWSDDTHRVIEFFGATCDRLRASSGGTPLQAVFGCPAPSPP